MYDTTAKKMFRNTTCTVITKDHGNLDRHITFAQEKSMFKCMRSRDVEINGIEKCRNDYCTS
jgi:hypothetical protein